MLEIILRKELYERGLSSRSAASEIGVAHTTLLRALRGQSVDVETIVKIANYLGIRPSELINTLDDSGTSLADQLSVLLSRSPELEEQLRAPSRK